MTAPTCTCTPHPYGDGPEVGCPEHGAVQALNQANRTLASIREQVRLSLAVSDDGARSLAHRILNILGSGKPS